VKYRCRCIGVRGLEFCGASVMQHHIRRFPDREIPDKEENVDPLTIGFRGSERLDIVSTELVNSRVSISR
jgi:hypothetical protein